MRWCVWRRERERERKGERERESVCVSERESEREIECDRGCSAARVFGSLPKSQSVWSHQIGDTSLFHTPLHTSQLASGSKLYIKLERSGSSPGLTSKRVSGSNQFQLGPIKLYRVTINEK